MLQDHFTIVPILFPAIMNGSLHHRTCQGVMNAAGLGLQKAA